MLRRAITVILAIATTLMLSGCLVTTKVLPAGVTIVDHRLIGAWRGINDDGKESDAFLHFLKQAPDKPLRLVWIEEEEVQMYDVTTLVAGKRHVFAALPVGSLLNPPEPSADDMAQYILGFYEMGEKEASFWLLDSTKVGELIAKGVVKGTKSDSAGGDANLTASPEELAKFLASDAAYAARLAEPAKMQRLTVAAPQ
jgi:hypothetical protein